MTATRIERRDRRRQPLCGSLALVLTVLAAAPVALAQRARGRTQSTTQTTAPAGASVPTANTSVAATSATTPPTASAPTPPAAEPDPRLEQARERQRRGRSLLDARNYSAALAEFERVYELLDGHPRRYMALSNIGRCYQSMGQYDRAMQYYERYLREAPAEAEDRAVVEGSIATLNDLLGTLDVTIEGPASAEVWTDNRLLGVAPGSLRLPGGRHVLEIRATGYLPARRELQLSAHDTVPIRFRLERPRGGISPAVFVTGAVVTGIALANGAVFGVLALAARGAADARRTNPDPTERFLLAGEAADRASIATLATVADISLVAGGVAAVGTTILAFVTDWRGRGGSQERAPSSPRASMVVVPGGVHTTVGAGGTF